MIYRENEISKMDSLKAFISEILKNSAGLIGKMQLNKSKGFAVPDVYISEEIIPCKTEYIYWRKVFSQTDWAGPQETDEEPNWRDNEEVPFPQGDNEYGHGPIFITKNGFVEIEYNYIYNKIIIYNKVLLNEKPFDFLERSERIKVEKSIVYFVFFAYMYQIKGTNYENLNKMKKPSRIETEVEKRLVVSAYCGFFSLIYLATVNKTVEAREVAKKMYKFWSTYFYCGLISSFALVFAKDKYFTMSFNECWNDITTKKKTIAKFKKEFLVMKKSKIKESIKRLEK